MRESYLKDTATVPLMKDELLLEERIQSTASSGGFSLGQALLATDQVDLDPGGGQDLRTWLALQSTCSDHLHLQVPSLVHQAELDVPEDGGAEDLSPHQLAGPEA